MQEQSKVIAHLQVKQQMLKNEKVDLMEQNKQQQDEITNVMTQSDDAKDKLTLEAATLRHKVQEQAKDIEIVLAKQHTLEKDKENLMRQNKQKKDDMARQIQLHDEL